VNETRTVPVAYLLAVKAHLETHVGRRKKYDHEASLLLDQTTLAIEEDK
jgi:hypothetical protein